MKLVSTEIQNFMPISKAKLALADRGLLLVQGENEDDPSAKSNGSGKSSIGDAVFWCNYGKTARGVTGDDVISTVAKKNTCVVNRYKDATNTYEIRRHRKHATHKNAVLLVKINDDGTEQDLSKGTDAETQVEINKLIGSPDVFCAAIYAAQENMPDLPGMTDKNLKLLIEESAGVQVLAEAYKVARDKALKATQAVGLKKTSMEGLKSNLDNWKAHLLATQEAKAQFDAGRKDRARPIAVQIRDEQNNLAEFQKRLALYDEAALKAELDALTAQADKFTIEKNQLATLQAKHSAATRAFASVHGSLKAKMDGIQLLKNKLGAINSRIGTPCGECGKAYCAHDMESAKQAQEQTIAAAVAEAQTLGEQAKKLKTEELAAEEQVKTFAAAMSDPTAVTSQISAVRTKQSEINTIRQQIKVCEAQIATLKARAQEIMTEANPHIDAEKKALYTIAQCEDAIVKSQGFIDALEREAELYEQAVEVFGPAGVRAHILDTVTPFLNDRTADYLSILSDGNLHAVWSTLAKTAKGELREKFNIEVTNDKGAKSFAGLSGGEKRKVRLATAMALQDMVAARAVNPIDLFVADEIDDALDEGGLERLMAILERKARERGTVLIISHRSLKDWVDSVITVKKAAGESTVSGAIE